MSVDSIVERYFTAPGVLAADSLRVGLQKDLAAHRRRLGQLQAIQVGAILVVLVMAIAALGFDLVSGQNLRVAVVGAAGVSIPTLMEVLRRTINEWSKTSLLLGLIEHSDEREARELLKKYVLAKAS